MASAPPSTPRPWWHEFLPAVSLFTAIGAAAFFYGGVIQRLTDVEKQAADQKVQIDQLSKDKEATIEKLSAIDGRTIRIETTLTMLAPPKAKTP